MQRLYKYNFFVELENKYQNYFKFANNICLLPPILKKVGVIYYLAFIVIEKCENIKRPIGVILINKVTGQEKVYDAYDYEFCPSYPDFDYEYYNTNLCPLYFPSRTPESEEYLKVSLDKLAMSSSSKFFNIDNDEYQKYLNRIKKMFPSNYFVFFEELQKNEFIPVDDKIRAKRDLLKIKNRLNNTVTNKQRLIENTINKRIFKKQFRGLITDYVKFEILPYLKGNGSYNKLNFYYNFGTYYKEFEKNITKYYSCYGFEIDNDTKEINTKLCVEKEQEQIRNIYLNCINPNLKDDVMVDTLSKVLIVFMNSMLVEEIHNATIQNFEDQIKESINIFDENRDKDFDQEAKNFLYFCYDSLLNDYNTSGNENLSSLYYGYLMVHFPFDL